MPAQRLNQHRASWQAAFLDQFRRRLALSHKKACTSSLSFGMLLATILINGLLTAAPPQTSPSSSPAPQNAGQSSASPDPQKPAAPQEQQEQPAAEPAKLTPSEQASLGLETVDSGPLDFNRDVRPILSDNCFFCHGPDAGQRQADLRLDLRDEAVMRRAIVPGEADRSLLMQRITTDQPDEIMPPPTSNKRLSARQKAILRRWIEQGAAYAAHWSFVPPRHVPLPAVKRGDWPRHGLDYWILAKLEAAGLQPTPEASKEKLLRRVTLDLTGLPPAPAELEAFLLDHSPDAYEKVVERLLQSPHYGERMAVDWLDAARYADSNGYQVDRDRELWPWRDWVIRAFNRNLSFDQFTIEQLAGDLLPAPTLEQRIATGFHRNHMLNEEGGVLAEEFLAEYTADRVETTAAVWLGQTFQCARCHDHKFDPFSQRDFYAMKAFFHNVPERGVGIYGNPIRRNAPPFVQLPAPAIEARLAELNTKLNSVNAKLTQVRETAAAGLAEWAQRVATTEVAWQPVELLSLPTDQPHVTIDSLEKPAMALRVSPSAPGARTFTARVRLPAGPLTALRWQTMTTAASTRIQWSEWKIRQQEPLALRPITVADSLATAEVAKLLDNNRKTELSLEVTAERSREVVVRLESELSAAAARELELEFAWEGASDASSGRLFCTNVAPDLLVPTAILELARRAAATWTAAERQTLLDFRLQQQTDLVQLTTEADALRKQIAEFELQIPTTLVMEESREPRPTFVLMRGAYDKPGEQVVANTPASLPAMDASWPRNRLGLAQWLVSQQNPLTARVTVNRLWQQLFGKGLVSTSEDFGSQGSPPTHPELLDWLALEFVDHDWDVKHLLRLLVTSATYRQDSRLTPELLERDPANDLLARGPRFRLPAEAIRDQALAVSGLLVQQLGGPSVKPYHPAGLYEQVTAGNGYNVYVPGTGVDLYRRSLYTYWKRSVPHPAMLLFDAPFRETCTLRRTRSNTPLQALNLWNDPIYVEAARLLARRLLRESGPTHADRVEFGFRLVLARAPRPRERAILLMALERAERDFHQDLAAAKQLLNPANQNTLTPEEVSTWAAYTMLATTLLNLDEAITKE